MCRKKPRTNRLGNFGFGSWHLRMAWGLGVKYYIYIYCFLVFFSGRILKSCKIWIKIYHLPLIKLFLNVYHGLDCTALLHTTFPPPHLTPFHQHSSLTLPAAQQILHPATDVMNHGTLSDSAPGTRNSFLESIRSGVERTFSDSDPRYPLVNVYITMENHHAINGKSHYGYL